MFKNYVKLLHFCHCRHAVSERNYTWFFRFYFGFRLTRLGEKNIELTVIAVKIQQKIKHYIAYYFESIIKKKNTHLDDFLTKSLDHPKNAR